MKNLNKITKVLQSGGVAVMPTDTIFGLVGRADNKQTVARIYKLKKRNQSKQFIILISKIEDLEKFEIKITKSLENKLKPFWPGRNSLIIENIAFRLPRPIWLRKLLEETGPLIAPSANPEGLPPAGNVTEAKKYFGQQVDYYLSNKTGKTSKKPSRLIKFAGKKVIYLR